MLKRGGTVRLQIHSNFDMVDFVQVVSDRVGQLAGLDEDTVHWIGVAVGNRSSTRSSTATARIYGKLVTVEFTFSAAGRSARARRPRPRPGRRVRARRSRGSARS